MESSSAWSRNKTSDWWALGPESPDASDADAAGDGPKGVNPLFAGLGANNSRSKLLKSSRERVPSVIAVALSANAVAFS